MYKGQLDFSLYTTLTKEFGCPSRKIWAIDQDEYLESIKGHQTLESKKVITASIDYPKIGQHQTVKIV
jgi:hypothetical protein